MTDHYRKLAGFRQRHSRIVRAWQRIDTQCQTVDYRKSVTMPIRDMWSDNMVIMFCVTVYGIEPKDIADTWGDCRPLVAAIERLGLDPYHYQAILWDLPTTV